MLVQRPYGKIVALTLLALATLGLSRYGLDAHASGPSSVAVVAPFVIAGVSYEPEKPLAVTEKPLFDTANPPKVRNYGIEFSGALGETVTGILTLPERTGDTAKAPFPAIILLHGLGGSRTQVLPMSVALANRGYASLAIDAAGHGGRKLPNGKPLKEWRLPEMRQIVAQTTVDLRRATDLLASRPEIDAKQIGYCGVSLGGIIGSVFVANEPRVRAASLWAAGGDWTCIIGKSSVALAQLSRAEGGKEEIAKIPDAMNEVDPIVHIAKASPRPILFLNGDNDTIVPTACGKMLFAAAKDVKKQMLLPGGHVPDITTMISETLTWFDKYVRAVPDAR